MAQETWYETIRDNINKSDDMSDSLIENIQKNISQVHELKSQHSSFAPMLKGISEYAKDTNSQTIGVTWKDYANYEMYKMCSAAGYDEGKDFFKGLVSTQGFMILAGKALVDIAGKKSGEWIDVAATQAKAMGGVLKEGVESLLNKVTDDKGSSNKTDSNKTRNDKDSSDKQDDSKQYNDKDSSKS